MGDLGNRIIGGKYPFHEAIAGSLSYESETKDVQDKVCLEEDCSFLRKEV